MHDSNKDSLPASGGITHILKTHAATIIIVLLLVPILGIFPDAFERRNESLLVAEDILDVRFLYQPADIAHYFGLLEEAGTLDVYAQSEVRLDVLFPLTYGPFLFLLLGKVSVSSFGAPHLWFAHFRSNRMLFLPIAGMSFDLFENITISFLASQFPQQPLLLAHVLPYFTALKLLFLVTTVVAILYGVGKLIYKRVRVNTQ